jgi:hypothetical protein
MRDLLIISFFTIMSSFSCESVVNDNLKVNETCLSNHFYYYFDEKYYIDTLLQNDYLLIGFYETSSSDDINAFLDSTRLFNLDNLSMFPESDYILTINRFNKSQTCLEINEIIENLETNKNVAFASYTYRGEFCIGFNCTELMSYSNEFVVSLNDTSDFDRLQILCENTDTWISDEMDSGYILLRVDKNSQGNALEMANLFYESGLFYFSEPNFHYFRIE